MTPLDPLLIAPAVFLAGVLMFLAPCTLPLVPGYLAFIAGVPQSELGKAGTRESRRRVLINAAAFIVGFSFIFIMLGLFAGAIGAVLGPWRQILGQVAGAIIILFGLTMLGWIRLPGLSSERHAKVPRFVTVGRWESSLLIGALFALGWSPCIGPILGTVLLFASTSATAWQGALLLGVFSLGLGVPFFVTALLLSHAGDVFARWGRGMQILSFIGGVLLVLLGLLMLFGKLALLVSFGYGLFEVLGYDQLLNYF